MTEEEKKKIEEEERLRFKIRQEEKQRKVMDYFKNPIVIICFVVMALAAAFAGWKPF